MRIHREEIKATSTGMRPTFHNVSKQVDEIIERSGIKNGFCIVSTRHTTCSVVTQECSFDLTYTGLEYLQQDLLDVFEKIIPICRKEGQYMHPGPLLTEYSATQGESKPETLNTDAHLRSMFLGRSVTVSLIDGKLDMGYGFIYFIDFDQTRSRERTIQVQVVGE